jgi:hypothetical protein
MAVIYNMIVVAQDQATADTQRDLIAETGQNMLAGLKLKDYFKMLTSGIRPGVVQTKVNAAKASGTFAVGTMVANDTMTINGIVFTAVGTAASALSFSIGGTPTITAANAVAKINLDSTLDGMIIATSVTSVITIEALVPGELGNALTIANSANATASAARLAGGTNGDAERTHYYGSGA